MMDKIFTYAKAHTAAILAVVFWLVAALHDGNISGPEWLGLPAALGIGGAVAAVPNSKPGKKAKDAGYGAVELLVVIILVIILIGVLTRWH